MFGLMDGYYKSYLAPKKIKILIIGPNGSGKTAFLERCKVTKFSSKKELASMYESLTTTATANNNDDDGKDSNSTEINEKQATTTTTMATYRRMFCSSNASFSSSKLTVLGDSGDDKGGIKIEQVSVVNNNNNKKQVNISIPDVDPCNNHEVDLRPGAKMLPLHKITPTGKGSFVLHIFMYNYRLYKRLITEKM